MSKQREWRPKVSGDAVVRHADTCNMHGVEIVSLRRNCSKTFALGRKMFQTILYPEKVHYHDFNGLWRDIDNRLHTVSDGLETRNAQLYVHLNRIANAAPLITMQNPKGDQICWSVAGANAALASQKALTEGRNEDDKRLRQTLSASAVQYTEIFPYTDLICELHGDSLKETLVLRNAEARSSYCWQLHTGDLAYRETADGGMALYHGDNPKETVFYLPAPYMLDCEGNKGTVITRWENRDNALWVTITLDPAFLRTAHYPVFVDPTVQSGQTTSNIADTFVSEKNSAANYASSTTLRVGKHDGYDGCKALVKINTLPSLNGPYTITKAWMIRSLTFRAAPETTTLSAVGVAPGQRPPEKAAPSGFAFGFRKTTACG